MKWVEDHVIRPKIPAFAGMTSNTFKNVIPAKAGILFRTHDSRE